jgi:ferredoxin
MKIEYDKLACDGWFQCVQEWDAFEMKIQDGVAELAGSEEIEDNVFVREVPEDAEEKAIAAAESCPVNAIKIFENDEQIVP